MNATGKAIATAIIAVIVCAVFTTLAFLNNRYFGYGVLAFSVLTVGPFILVMLKAAASMHKLDQDIDEDDY